MRSRTVPTTQSFPLDQSRSIRPTGIVLAILSTFLAIPVLMTGGAEGSGEILAAAIAVPESSNSSTSAAESTSSSLFDGSQSADLFQAGATIAVPYGQSIDAPQAQDGDNPAQPSPPTTEFDQPDQSLPATTAKPSTSAPASTSPATTAAPTTTPATSAAPTTRAAPVTQPVATQPPATTAPATTAPATTAPATTEPVATTPPPTEAPSGPTPEQWAQLRHCEASGSYTAVNPSGKYHGAYQFGIVTWDGLAALLGRTDLVGVKPSQASPADQDAMALELWKRRGPSPWPQCGRYLPSN